MLQNKLTEIKGRLVEMMFEMYRDMNASEKGVITKPSMMKFKPL